MTLDTCTFRYNSRWRSKYSQNGTVTQYELRSLNGDKNWYAVECDYDEGIVKIISEAEEVHPGIFSTLEGLQNLISYIKQKGALHFGDRVNEEVELLKKAGFTV